MTNGNAYDQSTHCIYTNQGQTIYGGASGTELSESEIFVGMKGASRDQDPLVKSVKPPKPLAAHD